MAWGNALADEAADIGRAMHFAASDRPVLGAGKAVASTPLTPEAEQICTWLKAVLSYVAKALPLFPRHQGQLTRMPPEGQEGGKGQWACMG